MIYKIPEPPASTMDFETMMKRFLEDDTVQKLRLANQYGPREEYLYWEDFRHKLSVIPEGMPPQDAWASVKFMRRTSHRYTALRDARGTPFTWVKLEKLERFCHELDMQVGGTKASGGDMDGKTKNAWLFRGLMEEAIASSQLEGAVATREQAKRFLQEGRKPRNKDENMILNNYLTIRRIEEDYKLRKLDRGLFLEIHRMMTQDRIGEGVTHRLRAQGERYEVADDATNTVYHVAPDMEFVEKELARLIAFANDELEGGFIHPVVKAIMLHFWVGYLHPFTDGNGRVARALFYWYLLRKEYWAISYLPISKAIRKSPKEYGMSYVYSEQDDCDLTYFIDYNVRKIQMAMREFDEYRKEKAEENTSLHRAAARKHGFNDRQILALRYLHKDGARETSTALHMNEHQITRPTAIHDLRQLLEQGFIEESRKRGHSVFYSGTSKIGEMMKDAD